MKKLIILATALFTVLSSFAQSKTVAAFEEEADGYKLFLYQSVIRMLNKDKNPDFNMLIRDLDHLRFVSADSTGPDAMSTFNQLDNGVKGEGFEEIMTFDNMDYICHVYELEAADGKSTWVATFLMDGTPGVIEMKGSLDMKYLKAFNSLNMDKVKELLPLEMPDNK